MPKIIKELEQTILEETRAQLQKTGYREFTIRDIAKKCNMALGTFYNYFQSKDMLIATVMLSDWKGVLENMLTCCEAAADPIKGLEDVYDLLVTFSNKYRLMWSEYSFTARSKFSYVERHKLLRSQISQIIGQMLSRFGYDHDENLDCFLAENLLSLSSENTEFAKYAQIFQRLMSRNGEIS